MTSSRERRLAIGWVVALCWIALLSGSSLADTTIQKVFKTPDDAGSALFAAARANDTAALVGIFGEGSESIVALVDPTSDQALHRRFTVAYEQKHDWTSEEDGLEVLSVGEQDWPFPIPLVETSQGWRFDTARGRQEILRRRIGRNEFGAIGACAAFVDAEREYWERNPMGGQPAYAQSLASSPGKKDGLFWKAGEGQTPSPLGRLFAEARSQGGAGAAGGAPRSFHGYLYRTLLEQGEAANGGAMDYVVDGAMTRGFALLAWPADYGVSGIMTFTVNQTGVVYEKDLGEDTAQKVVKIQSFDPDVSWGVVAQSERTPSLAEASPDS